MNDILKIASSNIEKSDNIRRIRDDVFSARNRYERIKNMIDKNQGVSIKVTNNNGSCFEFNVVSMSGDQGQKDLLNMIHDYALNELTRMNKVLDDELNGEYNHLREHVELLLGGKKDND